MTLARTKRCHQLIWTICLSAAWLLAPLNESVLRADEGRNPSNGSHRYSPGLAAGGRGGEVSGRIASPIALSAEGLAGR
jgi:hypothetical protein